MAGIPAVVEPSGDGDGQQIPIASPDGTVHYIRIDNNGEVKSV